VLAGSASPAGEVVTTMPMSLVCGSGRCATGAGAAGSRSAASGANDAGTGAAATAASVMRLGDATTASVFGADGVASARGSAIRGVSAGSRLDSGKGPGSDVTMPGTVTAITARVGGDGAVAGTSSEAGIARIAARDRVSVAGGGAAGDAGSSGGAVAGTGSDGSDEAGSSDGASASVASGLAGGISPLLVGGGAIFI